MSTHQKREMREVLLGLPGIPEVVRHGGCMGADWDFHQIVLALEEGTKLRVYPSDIERTYPKAIKDRMAKHSRSLRDAWLDFGSEVVADPMNPFERDRLMVDLLVSSAREDGKPAVLLAAPAENRGERIYSGTWATVRYARKAYPELRRIIVRPNGKVEEEGTW